MKKSTFFFLIAFLLNLTSYAQTIISPAGDGGFETASTFAGNGWTVANDGGGGERNEWEIGNPTGVGATGSRAAFISRNSADYDYNNNRNSVSHIYRNVIIPAGVSQVTLSFNWKASGEAADRLRVFLVPTTTTPVGGTQLTTGQIGSDLYGQSTYQNFSINLPCSAIGTTQRLVFSWRNNNDGSGANPPAALDNISLVATTTAGCPLGTGATVVASLPYSSGAGTTAGAINDITPSNVSAICGTDVYYDGEDQVWQFTPATSGIVTMTLTSGGTNTALMLYQGCPTSNCSFTGTGTCVAQTQSATGNKTMCASVTAGQTYYLILDSDPAPNNNAYTNLTISAPVATICSLGTGVINVASLPYSSGAGTTAGAVDDITSSNVSQVCGSTSYYGGEDRVWVFTPTTSGQVTIDLTSTGSWTGLMLYDGCPVSSCGGVASGICIAETQSSSGNKNMCADVVAGRTYYLVMDSFPAPNNNPYTNLTISAPVVASSSTCSLAGTYTLSSIAHSPDVLTSTDLSGFTDDVFYPGGVVATGFDFCLNGNQYQDFLISANGYIIFAPPTSAGCSGAVTNLPTGINAAAGNFSGYTINADIPNTTNAPRNAILGTWHDIDPSVTTNAANPIIRYQTFGTAPNRRFVVSWESIPMFSTSCEGDRNLDYTGQIKMFETTNNIEIHITRKRLCASWNSGNAIVGLHNYNGTQALVPTNRNGLSADWTATNEAYRFTFNNTTCTTCTPLPLNLMFFNGEWNKQTLEAELKWAFKDQKDAELYILEHSTDEVNFKEIAQIPVRDVNVYAYTHKQPSKGRNFYRIQKVIKNKKSEYSHQVTVINPIAESWQVESVYPNPTNTFSTKLDINSLDRQEMIIKVVNLQGVEQFSQKRILDKGHNTLEVDLKKVAKGTYLLVMNTATQIETRRIVIE